MGDAGRQPAHRLHLLRLAILVFQSFALFLEPCFGQGPGYLIGNTSRQADFLRREVAWLNRIQTQTAYHLSFDDQRKNE